MAIHLTVYKVYHKQRRPQTKAKMDLRETPKAEEQESSGIATPCVNDVLCGRGKNVNNHPGNKLFQSAVKSVRVEYVRSQKRDKPKFAKCIVSNIQNLNPPGRFLKLDTSTGLWYDIGNKKALSKTRQALREGAPELEGKHPAPKHNASFDRVDDIHSHQHSDGFQSLVKSAMHMYTRDQKVVEEENENYVVRHVGNADHPSRIPMTDRNKRSWYSNPYHGKIAISKERLSLGYLPIKESNMTSVIEPSMVSG